MNLKEAYAMDARAILYNTGELGEEIELGGRRICAMVREGAEVDSNVSNEFSQEVIQPAMPDRLVTLHVLTEDVPDEAAMGRSVSFNGVRHAVLYRSGANLARTRLILERQGY